MLFNPFIGRFVPTDEWHIRRTHARVSPLTAVEELEAKAKRPKPVTIRASAAADAWWVGVVVGHWFVGPRQAKSPVVDGEGRRPKLSGEPHLCASKCGAVAFFAPWQLDRGPPPTCVVCDPGGPGMRPIRPGGSAIMDRYWEDDYVASEFAIEEKSNLKGRPAATQWGASGMPLVARVLAGTLLGKGFGWKVAVRDCHEMSGKKGKESVRVRGIFEGQKRIELSIHPADSVYTFDVDLTTRRTEVPFDDVKKAVEAAVAAFNGEPLVPAVPNATHTSGVIEVPLHAKPAAPTQAVATVAAPAPAAPATGQVVDVTRVDDLIGKLTLLRSVGTDLNEIAAIKAVAVARVEAAAVEYEKAQRVDDTFAQKRSDAEATLRTHQERVDDLDRRLKAAVGERDKAAAEAAQTRKAADAAQGALAAAKATVDASRKELVDAEALAAEQAAKVGDASKLEVLLRALSALGG